MKIYTVSFFGHRVIDNFNEVENKLEDIVYKLLTEKEYVDFLVGREGDFDSMASSVIRRISRRLDRGNSSHILVLPYLTAEFRDNEESFFDFYSDVEIDPEAMQAHFKAAYQIRNKNMIDRSDKVIFYVRRKGGGAYESLRYAELCGKSIYNINE